MDIAEDNFMEEQEDLMAAQQQYQHENEMKQMGLGGVF